MYIYIIILTLTINQVKRWIVDNAKLDSCLNALNYT